MKKQQTWMVAALVGLAMSAGVAQATLFSYTFSSGFGGGSTVADGNQTGWTDSRAISDITGGDQIANVTVRLNLSGGFNGDIYGYLVLTDTTSHSPLAFSVLLNRVGTGSGSEPQFSFGYSDSALNVALSDTGANGNIHNYQNVGGYGSLITGGGAFQTDGGNLGAFAGAAANNTWTLFLADQSSGAVMQVNNWGLDIEVVPEPVTWAMMIFGALAGLIAVARRWRISKEGVGN